MERWRCAIYKLILAICLLSGAAWAQSPPSPPSYPSPRYKNVTVDGTIAGGALSGTDASGANVTPTNGVPTALSAIAAKANAAIPTSTLGVANGPAQLNAASYLTSPIDTPGGIYGSKSWVYNQSSDYHNQKGLYLPQNVSGSNTLTANTAFNQITVEDGFSGSQLVDAFKIQHNVHAGGTGGFEAFDAVNVIQGTTANLNNTGYYTTGTFLGVGQANDNGTASAPSGHLYATNPYARLSSGATYWDQLVGTEIDIAAQTGSSVADIIGQQIVQINSTVHGSRANLGLSLNNSANNTGWDIGFAFGAYSGNNPMAATGTLIGTWAFGSADGSGPMGTVKNGVDISAYTVTGYAWHSPGATIDGAGNVTANALSLTGSVSQSTVLAGPTGASGAPTQRQLVVADISGAAPTASPTLTGTINFGNDATHNGVQVQPALTGQRAQIVGTGVDATRGLNILASGSGTLYLGNATGGAGVSIVGLAGPGANTIALVPATTGATPAITFAGTDTNVGAIFQVQGSGVYTFTTATNGMQFQVGNTASAVNYLVARGGATTAPVLLAATGADAAIDIRLAPKTTGMVDIFGTAATTATTSSSFSATSRVQIKINGVAYWIPASTVAW